MKVRAGAGGPRHARGKEREMARKREAVVLLDELAGIEASVRKAAELVSRFVVSYHRCVQGRSEVAGGVRIAIDAERNHRQANRRAEAFEAVGVLLDDVLDRRAHGRGGADQRVPRLSRRGQVLPQSFGNGGRGDCHAAEAVVALVADAAVPRLLVEARRRPVDGAAGPQRVLVQRPGPDRFTPPCGRARRPARESRRSARASP